MPRTANCDVGCRGQAPRFRLNHGQLGCVVELLQRHQPLGLWLHHRGVTGSWPTGCSRAAPASLASTWASGTSKSRRLRLKTARQEPGRDDRLRPVARLPRLPHRRRRPRRGARQQQCRSRRAEQVGGSVAEHRDSGRAAAVRIRRPAHMRDDRTRSGPSKGPSPATPNESREERSLVVEALQKPAVIMRAPLAVYGSASKE